MKYLFVLLLILFWSCSGGEQSSMQESESEPYEVHCKEPLPIFTLGVNSNPTKEQEQALCECIWKNLGSWEREVSQKIAKGEGADISEMRINAFSSRFGQAMETCGGMKL